MSKAGKDKLVANLRALAVIVSAKHRQVCLDAANVIEAQFMLIDIDNTVNKFVIAVEKLEGLDLG